MLLFNSCSTFDFLGEKFSSIFSSNDDNSEDEDESESHGTLISSNTKIRNSINNSNSSKNSVSYKIPQDYAKAYSFRTDVPVQLAKQIPQDTRKLKTTNPSEYVKKCCEFINANSTDDFEKVKIAHDIVALNTKYDAKNFWAGTIPSQDYETVLKTGYAVCEGYSNLLKKFLDTLGFQNSKVTGYARGVGISLLDEKSTSSNHAWNLVKIQNEYYFIDSTWDSGYMSGKSSIQRYTTDWLFIKPEHFIYSHIPQNKSQQLLENPITSSEFLTFADFRPKFFEATENFVIENEQDENSAIPLKMNDVLSSIQFKYNLKNNYVFDFIVTQTEKNVSIKNADFTQSDGETTFTTIQFPSAGLYRIQLFYRKNTAKQSWSCAEFFVNAKEASSILYPTVYSNSFEAKIISPIESPLKKGETYHFEINCPSKNFVAIIGNGKITQMQKNENGNFLVDFEIPKNVSSINIGASNSERGSYQTIATYKVE